MILFPCVSSRYVSRLGYSIFSPILQTQIDPQRPPTCFLYPFTESLLDLRRTHVGVISASDDKVAYFFEQIGE